MTNPAGALRDPALERQLAAHLNGTRIGQPLYAFRRVGSTMEVAHALAADRAPEGTLVWAARQDQGRGRLGRVWESPEGGVYLSLIVRPTRPASEIPQLSLVAGLSSAEAIHELTRLFPRIRWPNDLLLNNWKVSGILVEARSGAVIVGIGINVATDPHALPETATSLTAAGAAGCDPYRLTGVLCRRYQAWYDVWVAQGFAPIREALRPWMSLFGQPIRIAAGSNRFEGTASDLDEHGRLLVRLDSGLIRPFEMGEVTLLK
jgi:BirA family biotin operon repressor/biotin-[acetyl-CoA-carboxylase] ligase